MKIAHCQSIRLVACTSLLAAVVVLPASVSAQQARDDVIVYRCGQQDGDVVFQDRPCEGDGKRVELPPRPPPERVEKARARVEKMIAAVQERTEQIRAERRQRRAQARSKSRPPPRHRLSPYPYHGHRPALIHLRRDRDQPSGPETFDLEGLRDGPGLPSAPDPPEIMGLPGRPQQDGG